jgi:peptidoglycan/LPS O-acetylase OafA/YrhL
MLGMDGLRAIAVIGVMLYHLNFQWIPGGFLGVTVFFVLSGYLITDLLIDEWNQKNKILFLPFMIRRFRRLAPALVVMIFFITSWVTLTNHSTLDKIKADLLPSLLYFSNWWYIFHDYSYFSTFGAPSPFTHIWSLAIEEQFYLTWPLLMILGFTLFKKNRFRVLAILLGVILSASLMAFLYIPGTDPSRVYYGTDTRAFSLLLGAVLAFLWPSQKLSKTLPKKASIVLETVGATGILLMIVMFFKTSQYSPFLYHGGMLILSFLTMITVAAIAHPASLLGKCLSFKPLRWIGERSYGIYLWHYPIIILTAPIVNTDGINFWRVIFQITATLVISAVSYRFVEFPIRNGSFINVLKGLPLFYRRIALGSSAAIVVFIIVVLVSFVTKAPSTTISAVAPVAAEPIDEIELIKKASLETGEQEGTDNQEKTDGPAPTLNSVTIIGDSVIHDVIPFFKSDYPDLISDYRVGRQMVEVPEVIQHLKENNQLGEKVIIQIGTNGPFPLSQLVSVIEGLEGRKVYLVNCRVPRPWESTVNQTLNEAVEALPNTILIDWYSASAGHAEYFVGDGVHLTKLGGESYANVLAQSLKD